MCCHHYCLYGAVDDLLFPRKQIQTKRNQESRSSKVVTLFNQTKTVYSQYTQNNIEMCSKQFIDCLGILKMAQTINCKSNMLTLNFLSIDYSSNCFSSSSK